MKKIRLLVLLLLALLLSAGIASTVAAATSFTDVADDFWAWKSGYIPYLVQKNVLNGYKMDDGTYTFKPDAKVTRAEFIKMLDETFGLVNLKNVSFSDVTPSDWFYPYFQKAAAQGYLLNYGSKANPNGEISREEAVSLLVRYLNLPPEDKSPASTFTDFSSINDIFKDYVLQAIYANLINGYKDDATNTYSFKPQGLLTRAEALTILYRAAGAIYNTTVSGRDAGAAASNNVITRGDIIVSDAALTGRNIVSEGAVSGTLTLKNCTISGTIAIRGAANVTFDNCTVDHITVFGGGTVSLINRTKAQRITVYDGSNIYLYSNTSLDTLMVSSGANEIKVSGLDSTIENIVVNADGFESTIMPGYFEIASPHTAIFAGSRYSGSSSDQKSFDASPFVTSDGTDYYLVVKPIVSGKLYAYLANANETPAAGRFAAAYESSAKKVSLNIERGKYTAVKLGSKTDLSGFNYVVFQLAESNRLYAPQRVTNEPIVGTGFSSDPSLYSPTTITFTPKLTGKVIWYYTDSPAALGAAEFLNGYEAKESALKGSRNVAANTSYSCNLTEAYLADYSYVAFMIRNTDGACGIPVVVSVGDNGFKVLPSLKTAGIVSFTSNVTADLYFYYSDSPSVPTADRFSTEYNRARYTGSVPVKANTASELKYETAYSSVYPYLVLALNSNLNGWYQPVSVSIDVKTGFVEEPIVISSSEVRFKPANSGTVQYYLTDSDSAPSESEFTANYRRAPAKYCGEADVYANYYKSIAYTSSDAALYPYMAIMLSDDLGNVFAPVLVKLSGALTNGFTAGPYVEDGKIYFRTSEDGEVFVFYSSSKDAVAAEEYYEEWLGTRSSWTEAVEIRRNTLTSVAINKEAQRAVDYAVIAFRPAGYTSRRDFLYPVVLDITEKQTSTISGPGITASVSKAEKLVTVRAGYEGQLYHYLTDDEALMNVSSSNFDLRWINAESAYGPTSLKANGTYDISTSNKRYVVICLKVDGEYLEPVKIDMKSGSSYSGLDDESNKDGTGFLTVSQIDLNFNIEFETKVNGVVTLYLYQNSSLTEIAHTNATKGVKTNLQLPFANNEFVTSLLAGSTCYLQLVDGSDKYEFYEIVIPINN
ncbi:MAG: S-layer homology domain-containing protein [Clostridia bacterium]|nr:S-layer homology domain-containing protein [Clostridia bacterium]